MGNEERDPADVNDASGKLVWGFDDGGQPVTHKTGSRPREGYVAPGHVSGTKLSKDHAHYYERSEDGQPGHHDMRRGERLYPGVADDWQANEATLRGIVDEARRLSSSTDWRTTSNRLRELREKMKTVGPLKTRAEKDAYWESFNAAQNQFRDAQTRSREERERNEAQGQREKERIVSRAETLASSSDLRAASQEMRQLGDQWKAAGRAPREAEDRLWKRFNDARTRLRAKGDEERKQREYAQNQAKAAKERIVSRAQSLVHSSDLREASQQMRALTEEWKKAGRASRDDEDHLWREFSKAKDALFAKSKAERDKRDRDAANAKAAKERIVSRAQGLVHSSDLREAGQQMRGLTEEWKKAGRASRDDEDRLWREFSKAKDALFAKSKAEREKRDRDAAQAKSVKEGLISQMRSLANTSDFKAARDQARALSDAFFAAGSAGREDNQRLKEQFSSAKQTLFDAINRDRERKQVEWQQRKREKLQNVEEAIRRTNDSIYRTDDAIRNAYSRLQEQSMRPQPSFTHPHYWDIIRKQSDARDRTNAKIRDMEMRRSSLQQKLISLGQRRDELLR